MGYIAHHAIVVTDGESYIKAAHRKAMELMPDQCSEIVGPLTNGTCSFLIAPDGSKEGWSGSSRGDEGRGKFLDWIKSEQKPFASDVVEVRFGGDEPDLCQITAQVFFEEE